MSALALTLGVPARRPGRGVDLRPERHGLDGAPWAFEMPRAFQRRRKIFRALALEFFLRGLEEGDAGSDFFPLRSGVVSCGHAHPLFLIVVPQPLVAAIRA